MNDQFNGNQQDQSYVYWVSMDNPDYVVRYDGKIKFESYIKDIGWHENSDRVDIIMGKNPFFEVINEKEALKIINDL